MSRSILGIYLGDIPNRGWGVLRLSTEAEVVNFAMLLAGGYLKGQSVSGVDRVFQVRLTGKGREILRRLDRPAVV